MKFPSRDIVERVRKEYPIGTRVKLAKMDDAQAPPIGTKGTVKGVDDTASIKFGVPCKLKACWGEDEQRNERAFIACDETSDMELVRTRDNGSSLNVIYGEDVCIKI